MRCKWSCFCFPGCKRDEDQDKKDKKKKSKSIDKQIKKDKVMYRRVIKVLLLGTSESGKSTFLKQVKIINKHQFSREELANFRKDIRLNMIIGMKVLIDARCKLNIPWADRRMEEYARAFKEVSNDYANTDHQFCSIANLIEGLWFEPAIKLAFTKRVEHQLTDTVRYYFDNIRRLSKLNYTPSTYDIIHCRKVTKTVEEYQVMINDAPFCFIDVGGQRSQRQKWFQLFCDVTSIIFMISSSEYDQSLKEDPKTNSVDESLSLWETICNHKAFTETSFIVFLNKTDLLKRKLQELEGKMRVYEASREAPKFEVSKPITVASIHPPPPQSPPPIASTSKSDTSLLVPDDVTRPSSTPPYAELEKDFQPPRPDSSQSLEEPCNTHTGHSHSRHHPHTQYIYHHHYHHRKHHHRFYRRKKHASGIYTYADYVVDFEGDPFASAEVQMHMFGLFKRRVLDEDKKIYPHFTVAIDTKNIARIFEDVTCTIMARNITELMIT